MRAWIAAGLMVLAVGLTTAVAAASTSQSRKPVTHRCVHHHRCPARSPKRKRPRKRHHKTNPMPGMNMSGGSMPTGSPMPSPPGPTGSQSGAGSSASSGSSSTGTQGGVATPARLQVTAREFSLTLSRATVPAGPLVIELVNLGQDAHNVHIRSSAGGPDVAALPTVQAGLHYDQQVTLAPGTYTVYCSMPGHEQMGMAAALTVS